MVAVVRGSSDSAAYLRLRAGYDSGDPELLQVFDVLARTHLRVYAGEAKFPLTQNVFPSQQLCNTHKQHHCPRFHSSQAKLLK